MSKSKVSWSFGLAIGMVVFSCGTALATVTFNESRISKIEVKQEKDHDILLRVDTNVKLIMDKTK